MALTVPTASGGTLSQNYNANLSFTLSEQPSGTMAASAFRGQNSSIIQANATLRSQNLEVNLWTGPDNSDFQSVDHGSELSQISNGAFARESPSPSLSIKLPLDQNLALSGGLGVTVALSLKNSKMRESSQFTLSDSARIELVGVRWDNVVFNIAGKGTARLNGSSSFTELLVASQQTLKIVDDGVIWARVTAWKTRLRGEGQIVPLPVLSR